MPSLTPDEIISIVNRMEGNRGLLHQRMDSDFDRYLLVTYKGEVGEDGKATLAGYKKFTSNNPGTTMDLALHVLSTARRIVRVHRARSMPDDREIDNIKELFCLGILEAVDERRARLLAPSLQDSLSSQGLFRGRRSHRVLFIREDIEEDSLSPSQRAERQQLISLGFATPPLTRTYADVTDWDPRNTYWEMNRHGLRWACHKVIKTRSEILAEWGIDPAQEVPGRSNGSQPAEDQQTFAVYDWFDEKENQVILEGGRLLKEATEHGMRRVPVSLGLVGRLPMFQAEGHDYDSNYGESFYKNGRSMFDEENFMYSILAELSKRSINQALILESKDGALKLKGDPRVSGSETSLSTDNAENIRALPPMEMVQASGAFMGIVSAMGQRATFPSSAFGELASPLSGFALTILEQRFGAPTVPFLHSARIGLKDILDIFCDAYAGGEFDTMTLSGRTQDVKRRYFSEQIAPEMIQDGGIIEVDFVPILPQDDQSKAALVQMLRDGPVPAVDDRFLRENMLQIQDVDQMEAAIWEQMAQRGSPVAVAFNAMMAAARQGDEQLATIWFDELQMAMLKKALETMMLRTSAAGAPGGEATGNGQQPGRPPLPRPQILPPQVLGIRNRPGMQAGPLVPPGTPRPGAQRPELRDFGLMG